MIKHTDYYTIEEGKHDSRFAIPAFYIGKVIGFEVTFKIPFCEEIALAKRGTQLYEQVNKIGGISSWFHKRNSIRIGWSPCSKERFFIHLYVKNKGKRITRTICSAKYNEAIEIFVDMRGEFISINGSCMATSMLISNLNILAPYRFGYILEPFFGGIAASPVTFGMPVSITAFQKKDK